MSSQEHILPSKRSRELPFGSENLWKGIDDVRDGLFAWRVWWVIAYNEVIKRYRRSAMGQFWHTISMLLQIVGMGLVFGGIFKKPMGEYIPYLGISIVLWTFLSSLLNELAYVFIYSRDYLCSYPGPRSAAVYQVIVKNIIISAHNMILVPFLWILAGWPVNLSILLFIPGLILCLVIMFEIGLVLGLFCARFRDIPMIVQTAVQLLFFVTPVLYHKDQLEGKIGIIIYLNPFASMMEVLRAPLIGEVPDLYNYVFLTLIAVVGLFISIPFYARYRARIVYWL